MGWLQDSRCSLAPLQLRLPAHMRVPGCTPPATALLPTGRCRFMGIAEQMGRVLQRTSISVNIKERLDFSCALFDENGARPRGGPNGARLRRPALKRASEPRCVACRLRRPRPT